jgi:membrane protein CcdC involved in cytochrome C biogenesis
MIAPLSLSDLSTVVFAVLCLMTIAPQARGRVVKLWRLAVPPCFAAVEAFVLLASVFDANLQNDAEWLLAAMVGLLFGRMRGWSVPIEVDQQHELIRQQRTADGPLMAIALLLLALTDFVGAALLDPVIEPQHVAAGAALCAGYLGGRALAIAVRTTRLPHVELYRA